MSIARLALLVALVTGLVPGPAPAADNRGCGGTYAGGASCVLVIRGAPLTLSGSTTAADARVRVWVTLDGWSEVPSPLGCEAAGAGSASCAATIPDDSLIANIPEQFGTVRLRCHVSGTGSGEYRCLTGREPGQP